ncbi:sortase [Luteipulveratus sp. YIM 133132]|uniref:sortase domain-containing protein n=1 Tax=Luteipulveratus flavus TaxID=3031728 RepID=UPI0023B07396|nr:sortase [Luteipulveratus sp. YIM 133132]MDE9364406.1 sortase [Luteipulveratus sp. YIM 133132]
MAAVFVVSVVALLGWAYHHQNQPTYDALPQPRLRAETDIVPVSGPRAGASQNGSAPASTADAVRPSPATQIYIPNADADLRISTDVKPLDGCRRVIDPPHSGPGFGGVFGCTDFAQPGTTSPSLTVVAGHSSKDLETAFNRLYVQNDRLVGQLVYLRTEASGDRWLVYRITAVHVPSKKDLPYLPQVWGEPGASTAGRLLLVTCRQQPHVTPAVLNYIAVGRLVGLR